MRAREILLENYKTIYIYIYIYFTSYVRSNQLLLYECVQIQNQCVPLCLSDDEIIIKIDPNDHYQKW